MEKDLKIFFSYSGADNGYLKLLKIFIKSLDVNDKIYYFDYVEPNETQDGSNYGTIHNNIKNCDYFISILSINYLNSTLCCWEAGLAYQEKINRSQFKMLAILTDMEGQLELERTFHMQYRFNHKGLTRLIENIKQSNQSIIFDNFKLDKNLQNLQKHTENILLNKILSNNQYSKTEQEKIKKLMC